MPSLFGGRPRKIFTQGRELGAYRNELFERTERVNQRLVQVADDIDALRRRALDPDEAVARLSVHEDALDEESDGLLEMLAPEELHGLHMEYEANLERANIEGATFEGAKLTGASFENVRGEATSAPRGYR